MPKSAISTHSGFVIFADVSILPDAINAIVTGEGATNYMQLKTIPCSISFDIQGREKIPWPPAPKYMLELNEFLDLDKLIRMLLWVKMVFCWTFLAQSRKGM